jgi:hypothetical protein
MLGPIQAYILCPSFPNWRCRPSLCSHLYKHSYVFMAWETNRRVGIYIYIYIYIYKLIKIEGNKIEYGHLHFIIEACWRSVVTCPLEISSHWFQFASAGSAIYTSPLYDVSNSTFSILCVGRNIDLFSVMWGAFKKVCPTFLLNKIYRKQVTLGLYSILAYLECKRYYRHQ